MSRPRRVSGFMCLSGSDLPPIERDTFTCVHCQRIVLVKPKASPSEMGGFCRLCDANVCVKCASGNCVPFLRKIEAMEEKTYWRKQFNMMAGL